MSDCPDLGGSTPCNGPERMGEWLVLGRNLTFEVLGSRSKLLSDFCGDIVKKCMYGSMSDCG